ncbi:alpha/beta fold hydrolase [Halomonas halocynthiae]|uniref:alpha/beta fold hydrolase n=1 Tax=Halomonas halocynthiae TaxID=176290 RepID=UPI0004844E13|nr:alpha/beta hydrolase [Halomonas halocynthiae]
MIESVQCYYEIEGNGPALVMIHGIGSRHSAWNEVKKKLVPNYTCVTYDLRGHGRSPVVGNEFKLDDLVADLEILRQKLRVSKMHLVGHSLGGMIGPAYARKYPDRVLSISILSSAAFRSQQDSKNVLNVVNAMEEKGIKPVLNTLTNRWFTDRFLQENPERVAARKKQVLETDTQTFLNVFKIYAETEMSPWLHEINQPCMVLTGENDAGCNPILNKKIYEALPNSKLVVLENLKHAIMIEAPNLVATHISSFIDSYSCD